MFYCQYEILSTPFSQKAKTLCRKSSRKDSQKKCNYEKKLNVAAETYLRQL